MSLFDRPSDQEAFWTPSPTVYVGELKSLEPFNKGKYGPSLKWTWVIFDINSGEPILHNGKPATFDQLSGTALTPRTKARSWVNKHLAPTREVKEGDDPDELAQAILGKRVRLSFGMDVDENDKEVVNLNAVLAYVAAA